MSLEEAAENIFEETEDGRRLFKSKVSVIYLNQSQCRAGDFMTSLMY